ncbi:MAG: hypothetical protein NQU46_05955 [Methanolinea sp.]|nr:hypothetical protein [Methanolinea sp.]
MDRYRCERCGREFLVNTGCTFCSPPPQGPLFCPECRGILRQVTPSYFVSRHEWDAD